VAEDENSSDEENSNASSNYSTHSTTGGEDLQKKIF